MKKFLLSCLAFVVLSSASYADYTDHRGYNIDSLETVVAGWTPERLAVASEEACSSIIRAFSDLMWAYNNVNPDRAAYFARKGLSLARSHDYLYRIIESNRILGQYHFRHGQYDSALFYYQAAEAVLPSMEGKYPQGNIDDAASALYGTIGNLYVEMDSIPKAMEYYTKAGEIFDQYGWNESNAVLYFNMGETWLERKDYTEARTCYEKSLQYGTTSGDSLWMSMPHVGLAAVFLQHGRTGKALQHLQVADLYLSRHEDQEYRNRIEQLDVMGRVLAQQKRQYALIAGMSLIALILLILSLLLLRRWRRDKKTLRETETILEETIDELPKPAPEQEEIKLNDREIDILHFLAEGKETAEIADRLCLGTETIKWYRKRLRAKFGVTSSAAVVAEAIRRGVI